MGAGHGLGEAPARRRSTRSGVLLLACLLGLSAARCGARTGGFGEGDAGADAGRVYLEGFWCGGITGNDCPPASDCDGCQGFDCASPCFATQSCDPAVPSCPLGVSCAQAVGKSYCLPDPEDACDIGADCRSEEYCSRAHMDAGICVPVERRPALACEYTRDCPWPYDCSGDVCRLFCSDIFDSCPPGWFCADRGCRPPS